MLHINLTYGHLPKVIKRFASSGNHVNTLMRVGMMWVETSAYNIAEGKLHIWGLTGPIHQSEEMEARHDDSVAQLVQGMAAPAPSSAPFAFSEVYTLDHLGQQYRPSDSVIVQTWDSWYKGQSDAQLGIIQRIMQVSDGTIYVAIECLANLDLESCWRGPSDLQVPEERQAGPTELVVWHLASIGLTCVVQSQSVPGSYRVQR